MRDEPLDVVGIGNAIVDVLAQASEAYVTEQELPKGSMTLIDMNRAESLYASMGPAVEVSGGSCANTMAGLASLGGRGGFIGKVRNDQLGGIFRHDIRATGIEFATPPATEGPPTARCLILVTPDAQRTMATYLGISVQLGPEEVDHELIRRARVLYLEGYLWDSPAAKQAFLEAAETARAAGAKVALSLSDPFCVDRHRESFRDLVRGHVDLLFANEAEIVSLYQADDFDAALQQVRGHCEVAALTRSEKGSVVLSGEEVHLIDAIRVGELLDTTGAGDLYAAGFLYGLTHGYGLAQAGKIAGVCAAEVIAHVGARPEVSLKELVKSKVG